MFIIAAVTLLALSTLSAMTIWSAAVKAAEAAQIDEEQAERTVPEDTMTIKTLTLTQPWATLVAIGAKRIETRSWKTNYRGPLAIHAAKGFPKWARFACLLTPFEAALREGGYNSPNELPIGQVVAVARLVTVYKIEPLVTSWRWQGYDGRRYEYELTPSERAFGQYNPGRYAWMLADVRRLAEPVPARGSLGLWEIELPEENAQSLRKQPD